MGSTLIKLMHLFETKMKTIGIMNGDTTSGAPSSQDGSFSKEINTDA